MAITVSNLCADAETTYGMKLLAGKGGLGNVVRWVHIIEDIEVPNFLHGSELIFTTGIAQTFKKGWLLEFIDAIIEKNVSGLVINIGPYIDKVPQEVVDYCDEKQFPLFVVPWSIRLIDITYDFCHKLIEGNEIEIGLSTAFRNLIFSPYEEQGYKPTLERHCFYADSTYQVIAFEPVKIDLNEDERNRLRLFAQKAMYQLKTNKLFALFFQDRYLIVILKEFNPSQIEEFLLKFEHMRQAQHVDYSLNAGISSKAKGYLFMPEGYHQAVMALRVSAHKLMPVLKYDDMGIYKLLVAIEDQQVLKNFYAENLKRLEDFDQKNNTDYFQTLRYYLEFDCSVQEVAKRTFVHRNTVNYKIKKIREILDIDFTAENKLVMMLCFLIKDLI